MARGLGPYQCEVLQRIDNHMAMFGDAKVGDIAKEMALARGLVAMVVDCMSAEHKVDVAHVIGLRHTLAMLERRGLVIRYGGGWVELTGVGAAMVGECALETKDEATVDCSALD